MVWRAIFFSVLALGFIGCKSDKADDGQTKTVKFSDDRYEITVPAKWNQMELNPEADLEMGAPTGPEAYMLSIVEAADDLPEDVVLEDYCAAKMGGIMNSRDYMADNTTFEEYDVGDLYGLRTVVTGRIGTLYRVQGWLLCFESAEDFIVLFIWSSEVDFGKYLRDFNAMVASFKQTGG